jgi:thiol-disulfide isomerase/thioredoxin
MRSYGQVLVRLDAVEAALERAGLGGHEEEAPPEFGLEPGTPVPDAAGSTLADLLHPGLPLLLIFTSPSCGPCHALLPDAAGWQRDHADRLTVAFASDGDAHAVAAEAAEFELEHVVRDPDHELYRAFEANGTPSAVVVAPDGTIASWVAPGREWIERLVDELLGADEAALAVGAEPPDVELPLLDGGSLRVADLRGRQTLLLFWNPQCGFCRAMHERLRAWERRNGSHPRLVVVSAGDVDEVRGEGFQATVALDPDFAVGEAFGAGGTPMAVLLDAGGRVAAPLAAGEEAIFELTAPGVGRPA